jgi:methionyl-tRNA formyltransferase
VALRTLFFGTPAFAVPSLDRLAEAGHTVAAVVTQPDRPKGRGQRVAAPPVKARALERGLTILQPDRPGDEPTLDRLRSLHADLGVVAAYGKILPQPLLDVPRLGFVNVHASLLPRWRGAAPVHRAILAGDDETGVTIMRVVLALDAGPMLSRAATPIGSDETSASLEARLAELGGRLLVETIDQLGIDQFGLEPARGEIQDEQAVTYAAKLERRDGIVNWDRPARRIHDQIRGLHPWPLAEARLRGTRLLLRRSLVATTPFPAVAPGTIVDLTDEAITVACAPGHVRLVEVQPEDRRPMAAGAFLRGYHVAIGDAFEPTPSSPRPVA